MLCLKRRYGKINASDKVMFENQKKRENVEKIRKFCIDLYLGDRLDIKFTAIAKTN